VDGQLRAAAHRLDQQTHHREADAAAAVGAGQAGAAAHEPPEDHLALGWQHAGAAVDHVQHQLTGWAAAGGEDHRAIGVEQGVVHQGGEALLQAMGVGAGDRWLGGGGQLELQAGAGGRGAAVRGGGFGWTTLAASRGRRLPSALGLLWPSASGA